MRNLRCGYLLGTIIIILISLGDIVSGWWQHIYNNPLFANPAAILAISLMTSALVLFAWVVLFYVSKAGNIFECFLCLAILLALTLNSGGVYIPIALTTNASKVEKSYYSDLKHELQTTVTELEESVRTLDELEKDSIRSLKNWGVQSQYQYQPLKDRISTADIRLRIQNMGTTPTQEEVDYLLNEVNNLIKKVNDFVPYNTIMRDQVYKQTQHPPYPGNVLDNIHQIKWQIPSEVQLKKIGPSYSPLNWDDVRLVPLVLLFIAHFISPLMLQGYKYRDNIRSAIRYRSFKELTT